MTLWHTILWLWVIEWSDCMIDLYIYGICHTRLSLALSSSPLVSNSKRLKKNWLCENVPFIKRANGFVTTTTKKQHTIQMRWMLMHFMLLPLVLVMTVEIRWTPHFVYIYIYIHTDKRYLCTIFKAGINRFTNKYL